MTTKPVYTIGHRESYTKGLAEMQFTGSMLIKVGKHDDYPGGIIFATPSDARKYIKEELEPDRQPLYAVWEVDADWEEDCKQIDETHYWKYLQVGRPIVCMVIE